MPSNATNNTNLDNLYLKFFKYAVVGLMTLALLSIIVLLPMAAYYYFQSPLPPIPAKEPPERVINIEDLKKFLIDEEKRRQELEKNGGAPVNKPTVTAPATSLLYLEQTSALYRCSEEFRTIAQQPTDNSTPVELAARNENLRANIERLADHQFRGSNWVTAMVNFTCSVLKNAEIAKLKKDQAIGLVVNPTINFHARAWASIQKENFEFRQAEERRVVAEITAEAIRVGLAKARALILLSVAGGAVLFFMAMALYLIFAKMEENLASIHRALVYRSSPVAIGE